MVSYEIESQARSRLIPSDNNSQYNLQYLLKKQHQKQSSYIMNENLRMSKVTACERHLRPLVSICVAPECSNFRQLCEQCIHNDHHHAKMHFNRSEAFMKIQDDIDNLFKGLKALRKKIIQTMDTKVNSQHGLNEIEEKLEQIKKMLNNKIDNFHTELRKIYEKNVKDKLNQLFYIVEKSHQFLEQQKIKLFKTQKLRPFFVNDLNHQLKYYQSYYEEILQKNVRRFKAGFEHDKVLKLMVSFQQNLSQIFKFETTSNSLPLNRHIMFGNEKGHFILSMKANECRQQRLNWIGKQDSWIGILPSVYYAPKDSYYLIGDGSKESNKIRRMNVENREIKDLEVKLETKRMNFAVCLFNQEIFIVGGENSKEGCLAKCEKFIPSEGKLYIVGSLNQRSAQHSLCVYKNKFILKFGGTDIIGSILEAHSEMYYPLAPQIYSAQTQDWKMLSFQGLNGTYIGRTLNFGLWPGIFSPYGDNKIIILSGQQILQKNFKSRYDITIDQNLNELNELEVQTSKIAISDRNLVLSECSAVGEDDNIYFLVLDRGRNSNIFFNAFITRSPTSRELQFHQENINFDDF